MGWVGEIDSFDSDQSRREGSFHRHNNIESIFMRIFKIILRSCKGFAIIAAQKGNRMLVMMKRTKRQS